MKQNFFSILCELKKNGGIHMSKEAVRLTQLADCAG